MIPAELENLSGAQIRQACRSGAFDQPTCGVAKGYVQANLVVLSREHAADFEQFCKLNPKPCPLLEITQPGVFEPSHFAHGGDVRSDLPRYRVYRAGECVDQPNSIEHYCHEDSVSFLIGCSFTFESALLQANLPVRHLEEKCNVPMYRTNLKCQPSGAFSGPLIVSMRPMTPEQAQQASRVTSGYPRVHGAPIQIDKPERLGISQLDKPDYGDAVTIRAGEVPVFWACGVTPMAAIIASKIDLAITHEPGHMLVTDVLDQDLCKSLATDG